MNEEIESVEVIQIKDWKPEDYSTTFNIGSYTPGPWRWHIGNHGEFLICSQSGGFAPLARVKGDKRSTLKAARANVHLMAAAPDLLKALYAMMEHCYDPDRDDDIVKAYKLARDAIGKAEGFK